MAQFVRPLIVSPASKLPFRRCINSLFDSKVLTSSTGGLIHRRFLTGTSPSILIHRKNLHLSRSRGLRPADAPLPPELSQSDNESNSSDAERKSRNEKKRQARRSFRWGMELADLNDSQIKRILRVVSLEKEVFDALMLAKRLGRDVREGKRRQFSYIGRLLRDVEPELMEGLIKAMKDSDVQKFQELSGSDKLGIGDANEEEEEITDEEEEEELRKLVRSFCSMQDRVNATSSSEDNKEGEKDVGLMKAKRHLTRFLVSLAKQLPTEENYML
ncbi:uncharacterized protein LOC111921187 isoform X2 [Lactuca sativa]|uniref:uncharacterized protein LOC111921187 isoform X2 n=1 Tax=Lactuca sativa TaxID=4236 RepID=UPI000CD94623|nr:uncharacterized protein LOC111921187 isoform X2 [Lactuca sativa]